MPTAPRYYVARAGQRAGPHNVEVLKQLADVQSLTADTLIALESLPNDWSPLRAYTLLHTELFPPRPHYALATDRPVENVNQTTTAVAPSVEAMLRENLLRQRAAEGELLPPQPPRANRRRRDYLIVAGLINGLVAVNVLLGRPLFDPFLVGFFVMGNISLAWVLYGVMDRY